MNELGVYRRVHVRMWRHGSSFQKLTRLNPSGQALWLYLLTSEHSIIIPGVVCAGPATIAETLKWSIESFHESFEELSNEGMVIANFDARIVFCLRGPEYMQPHNPNVLVSWGKEYNNLPECDVKNIIYRKVYEAVMTMESDKQESFAKSFRKSFGEPLHESFASQDKDKDKDRGKGYSARKVANEKSDDETRMMLAGRFFEHVKSRAGESMAKRIEELKEEYLTRYADTFRLMIERDGHRTEDILNAIAFIERSKPNKGGFCWGNVILSDTKFRKHMKPGSQFLAQVFESGSKEMASSEQDLNTSLGGIKGGEF